MIVRWHNLRLGDGIWRDVYGNGEGKGDLLGNERESGELLSAKT